MPHTLTLTEKQASKLLTIASTLSELGSDSTVVRFARGADSWEAVVRFARGADSWEAEITTDGSLRINKYTGDKYTGCEYHDSHHDFATAYAIVN